MVGKVKREQEAIAESALRPTDFKEGMRALEATVSLLGNKDARQEGQPKSHKNKK